MTAQGRRETAGGEASGESQGGFDRGLELALAVVAAAGFLTLALTLAPRMGFPWPLEWMEGGVLQQALQLAQGKPLYAAPSSEFVAYLYPPLTYVPVALTTALWGPTLPAARLPALLATAASLWALYRVGKRAAGGRPVAGLASAGLFAMGFGYCGGFGDLVRIDAVFIALLLWAVERTQAGRERSGLWLLAISIFAKQHGLLLLVAASVAILWRDRRAGLTIIAWPWVGVVSTVLVLQVATDGWFLRYTWELPASHGLLWSYVASFFVIDVMLFLPLLSVCALRHLWLERRAFGPLQALLIAAVVASAMGRAHAGGEDNVRLPMFAVLCGLMLAPALGPLLSGAVPRARRLALLAAVTLQFGMIWQPPAAHAPTSEVAEGFAELQAALLRCADGGTAVALDYGLLAGTPFMHSMALSDLRLGETPGELYHAGIRTLVERLGGDDAPAAFAMGERIASIDRVVRTHYQECARVPSPAAVTGYRPPPQVIYRHVPAS